MRQTHHIVTLTLYSMSLALTIPAMANSAQSERFQGMGDHTRIITTRSQDAQQWFNQGLTWLFAFNHDEAIHAFQQAVKHDKTCAMAWWGVSLASGPQYNHPVMTKERTARAWQAMQKALDRLDHTTPLERALIQALRKRNAQEELDSSAQAERKKAYAAAMRAIWEAHPNDADVGMLYAEAMMILRPWQLYASDDRTPAQGTLEIRAVLERVIALSPRHPGALHLYIHAVEPSRNPGLSLFAADRLCDLVPASGHLLHMPCHIYVQTAHWDRAIVQSEKSMAADDRYRRQTSLPIRTQHGYMIHNSHMGAFAAMMSGREREAMKMARDMWIDMPQAAGRPVDYDGSMCCVYDVQKRFGRWDAILAEPVPPQDLPITQATWRAARAVAYAAKKDFNRARREYEAFLKAKAVVPEDHMWTTTPAQTVLDVSDFFIRGEIELQQGHWDRAAGYLTKAAAIEDTIMYMEPPQWLQPMRHTLGAVYMKAEKYAEAERVYREDLAKWPGNGWSLYGLGRALAEQGRARDAADVMKAYQKAWAQADEPIETSCKCIAHL